MEKSWVKEVWLNRLVIILHLPSQITINDLPVGRSVDETLRLVEAFQFTDEHGEVCPAGWQKGDKTIKPDSKASLEYFGSA